MALQARPLHVPAGLPINEVSRAELTDVGTSNRTNVNVRHDEVGALGKRVGYSNLSRSRLGQSDRSAGRRLIAPGGVPAVIDGTYLDSYAATLDTSTVRSRVPEATYRTLGVPVPGSSAFVYDVEVCNGFVAVSMGAAYSEIPQVTILEADTGAVVRSPEEVGSDDGSMQLASYGDRYIIGFLHDGAQIKSYILDTQTLSTGWSTLATVEAADATTVPAVCSLSNRVAIAYAYQSGTNRLKVKTYSAAGLLESTTIDTASETPNVISLDGSIAGTLWVMWAQGSESSTIKAMGLDADVLATPLATVATVLTVGSDRCTQLGITEGSTAGTARCWAIGPDAFEKLGMVDITTSAGATTPGTQKNVPSFIPNARGFRVGTRYYVPSFADGYYANGAFNEQNQCIVADWTDNVTYVRPIANLEPGLVVDGGRVCKVVRVGTSSKYIFALATIRSGSLNTSALVEGNGTSGVQLVELDFASRHRWRSAEHAGVTYLGGALLSVFDGDRVTESGILHAPHILDATFSGTGITGAFRYVAVYEDVDAAGNWVISAVSEPTATINATDDTVNVTVAPLAISSRISKGATRIAIYRTADGGEPPYYRVGAAKNVTSGSSVSFADAVADATLTTHAQLYAPSLPGTAGEALDRRAPPGLPVITSYNGVLVGARGSSILYSGQEVYGEAVWHSPVFEVPISGGGDVIAVAGMDGTLFVWKRGRIYALVGEAPSDNGLQGGFGAPRLLSSDSGCIDPASVVVTSLGVFFQSARGIELLTRSQSVEYVGEPVKNTLASYPVVTSAVLDDVSSLVFFSCVEAIDETTGLVDGDGRDLVFDLARKAWVSVDNKTGSHTSEGSQDATMIKVDGVWRYAWLGTDGIVRYEKLPDDATAYLDGSAWVTALYEIPPLKLGLQQDMRSFEWILLVENRSAAGLQIEVAHDFGSYDSAWTKVWDFTETDGERQFPFRVKDHAKAVQLRIRDTAPVTTGTGQGFTFIGISADVAPKQGTTRGTPRLDTSLRR